MSDICKHNYFYKYSIAYVTLEKFQIRTAKETGFSTYSDYYHLSRKERRRLKSLEPITEIVIEAAIQFMDIYGCRHCLEEKRIQDLECSKKDYFTMNITPFLGSDERKKNGYYCGDLLYVFERGIENINRNIKKKITRIIVNDYETCKEFLDYLNLKIVKLDIKKRLFQNKNTKEKELVCVFEKTKKIPDLTL